MPLPGMDITGIVRRARARGARSRARELAGRGFSIYRTAVLLVFVFVVGVTGFSLIEGHGLRQAVYTTSIVLSTVGLATGDMATLSPGGQIFTVFLIWGGVGTFAYLLTQVVGFVVSGELNEVVRARKMEKIVASLTGHIIVCGAAEATEQAIAEVEAVETPGVLVCGDKAHIERMRARFPNLLVVEGPAIEAHTLERANVGAAKALLACLPTDAENLFLVMTAREIAPELLIVAEATDPAAIDKLAKVGADHVVAPAVIAGTRMASVALRPTALAFLDVLVRSGEEALRLEEVRIPADSRWAGSTLAEVRIPQRTKLLVMGMRHSGPDGKFVFNPSASERLHAGDALIVLGSPPQREELRTVLAEKRPPPGEAASGPAAGSTP